MPTYRSARAAVAWLVVCHAVIDAYALVVPFLIPILLGRFVPADQHAFYAGAFAAAVASSTGVGGLLFGIFADRTGGSAFLWGGMAVAAVALGLLGLAPSLPIAFALILAGVFGVAAFHPPAASAVGRLSHRARGSGISFFLTGGNVGQAVGPFLLILALGQWGPRAFPWSVVPGLVLALLLARGGRQVSDTGARAGPVRSARQRIPYGPLVGVFLIVVIRTVTHLGFLYFLAVYLTQDLGLTGIPRAGVQAGFIFLGSMGILLGGRLSDRMPRIPLLAGSLVLPVPLLIVALRVDTGPFIVLLLLGNFLMQAAAPIYVVLAQEVMPGRENLGSTMAMGVAWGLGGLLALPIGAIAGHLGLLPVLTALAALPLAALPLLLLVDSRRVGAPEATTPLGPVAIGNREST